MRIHGATALPPGVTARDPLSGPNSLAVDGVNIVASRLGLGAGGGEGAWHDWLSPRIRSGGADEETLAGPSRHGPSNRSSTNHLTAPPATSHKQVSRWKDEPRPASPRPQQMAGRPQPGPRLEGGGCAPHLNFLADARRHVAGGSPQALL